MFEFFNQQPKIFKYDFVALLNDPFKDNYAFLT